MRYKPKDHTLKNGVLCHLRSPLPADAAAILHLMKPPQTRQTSWPGTPMK